MPSAAGSLSPAVLVYSLCIFPSFFTPTRNEYKYKEAEERGDSVASKLVTIHHTSYVIYR